MCIYKYEEEEAATAAREIERERVYTQSALQRREGIALYALQTKRKRLTTGHESGGIIKDAPQGETERRASEW